MKDIKKKFLKNLFKISEKEIFKESSPLSFDQLSGLLDFLQDSLSKDGCDETFSKTCVYLNMSGISNHQEILSWLEIQGCFCDCEVLNLEEKCDYLK